MKKFKPILLIILDGWGISPSWGGNALAVNTPANMNRLWRDYPHKVLQAFTLIAGKYGIVGDSRLGHSTIAAGRRIVQDLEYISQEVDNRNFYKNKELIEAINHCKKNKSNLHLLGLISNGGIHAHINHLKALLELCLRENFKSVYIDAISDGVDTGEFDCLSLIEQVNKKITETGLGQFSSIIGRTYAMDRIGNKEKTTIAYEMLTNSKGDKYKSVKEAIANNYRQNLNDLTLMPSVILNNNTKIAIRDNDAVIFFNFRSDRSIQLLEAFINKGFGKLFYKPKMLNNLKIVTFTKYQENLPVAVAFKREPVKDSLGEVLSDRQEKQLRIAEQEKAAHVTNFFNCGQNMPFAGEDRVILASKSNFDPIKNYQMATPQLTKRLISILNEKKYDFIVLNIANVDMISHTGNMIAAGKAIDVVDESVGVLVDTNLKNNGATIITADHGNIEQMVKINPEQDAESKHTLNPVPFMLITPDNKKDLIKSASTSSFLSLSNIITAKQSLADIAPTILELMEIPKPKVMTGHSLLGILE